MMRSERNRMDDSSPLCYHIELVSSEIVESVTSSMWLILPLGDLRID